MTQQFQIEQTSWEANKRDLIQLRTTVFINEQMVPPDLEWDGYDSDCWHVIAKTLDGLCVGTARMLYDGHIGRMAVLSDHRRKGIGSGLLEALHIIAKKQGVSHLFLHAQTSAIDFYKQHGYTTNGNQFMEADIPHISMEKII